MIVLGIETSCDETAVAIVKHDKTILSHQVFTQLQEHIPYGGVVPEIAARAHLNYLAPMIQEALKQAQVSLSELDGIAATAGPGLIGGLMVGVMMAKSMAAVHEKPFLAINHLVGHALAPRLTEDLEFPYLLLLVSGGHCQLVIVHSPLKFDVLGTTQDDAVGECLDKCAKMMGLPYPGGPNIEKIARQGCLLSISLPTPLKGKNTPDLACQFSFSGLKSAVRRLIEMQTASGKLTEQFKADLAFSLQHAVAETLKDRLKNALNYAQAQSFPLTAVVLSGGVAANQFLRNNLNQLVQNYGLPLIAPPLHLCTDNGAMIAWAGLEKLQLGLTDSLTFKPRPRWPLDAL